MVFNNDFSALLRPKEVGAISIETDALDSRSLFQVQPETGICRVVYFSPRHDLTLPEMPIIGVEDLVRIWAEQTIRLGRMDNVSYVQVFENKGAMMSCSNPTHTARFGLAAVFPKSQQKRSHPSRHTWRKTGAA